MYDELLNTVMNTKRWTGSVQDIIIHPEDMRKYSSEARKIVPLFELEATDMTRMCDLPIKTSTDCQRGRVYFGIRFVGGDKE